MTLNEAIAEIAVEAMRPECWEDSCDEWVDAMIETAKAGCGYSRGLLWGAFQADPHAVCVRLRRYWHAHARPEPVEEWTQITAPDLVGAGFISGAADEEDGDGFKFCTRSDARRREFRVYPVEGTKLIISERTGGDAA